MTKEEWDTWEGYPEHLLEALKQCGQPNERKMLLFGGAIRGCG